MGLTRSGTSGFLNKNLFPHFFQRLSLATLVGKSRLLLTCDKGLRKLLGLLLLLLLKGGGQGRGLGDGWDHLLREKE